MRGPRSRPLFMFVYRLACRLSATNACARPSHLRWTSGEPIGIRDACHSDIQTRTLESTVLINQASAGLFDTAQRPGDLTKYFRAIRSWASEFAPPKNRHGSSVFLWSGERNISSRTERVSADANSALASRNEDARTEKDSARRPSPQKKYIHIWPAAKIEFQAPVVFCPRVWGSTTVRS